MLNLYIMKKYLKAEKNLITTKSTQKNIIYNMYLIYILYILYIICINIFIN